jgi:ribosomal protein L7Ae-like RNA K-turn-binding protein
LTRALSLLGIAKKAGFLAIGEESVSAAARTKKARVILSASDASDSSKRRARGYGETYGIAYAELPAEKLELAALVGRGSPGMLAVTDHGLAFGIVSRLSEEEPEKYAQLAALLQVKAERALKRRRETVAHKRNKRIAKGRTNK